MDNSYSDDSRATVATVHYKFTRNQEPDGQYSHSQSSARSRNNSEIVGVGIQALRFELDVHGTMDIRRANRSFELIIGENGQMQYSVSHCRARWASYYWNQSIHEL